YDNFMCSNILNRFTEYRDCPAWIDDVIRGSISTALDTQQSTNLIAPYTVFRLLQCLGTITAENVTEATTKAREALGDKPYSLRHSQRIAKVLRCASAGITQHAEQYPVPSYTEIYDRDIPYFLRPEEAEYIPPFKPYQLKAIREAAIRGAEEANSLIHHFTEINRDDRAEKIKQTDTAILQIRQAQKDHEETH
ncbi:MAG: hypothetical protein ACRCYZ_04120, partial [Alphaproteobacteria bacterium]